MPNPVNDNTTLAALLGIQEVPFSLIIGKPPKGIKSIKVKNFSKRVQKTRTKSNG